MHPARPNGSASRPHPARHNGSAYRPRTDGRLPLPPAATHSPATWSWQMATPPAVRRWTRVTRPQATQLGQKSHVATTFYAGSPQPAPPPHSHESALGHSPEWHGVTVCVLAATAWALAVAGVSLIKAGDDTLVTAADLAIQGALLPSCTHRVAARGAGPQPAARRAAPGRYVRDIGEI